MLFQSGLSYSAINSSRSALSALGLCFDNILVGKHPTVIRFMRGVHNLRPSSQNNVHIWDVSMVLRFLRSLSPVADLSLKNLTFKLVMMISLTNASRVQTICMLNIQHMEKHAGEFVFRIVGLMKQSRPGYKNPPVILKAYPPDRRLCVYTILKEYLRRTSQHRLNNTQLILSYSKPFKPVKSNTVSRWIKTCLFSSGIDTDLYTAHSVRSAAVSKAKSRKVPIDDILAKAGWSNVRTFAAFYDKQIDDDQFANNVLCVS